MADMEMKRINAGKLLAIGYDARERVLRVEFDDGRAVEHSGVGAEVWRRLASSGAAWSFYRDNIEEEYTARPASASKAKTAAALDELFKK